MKLNEDMASLKAGGATLSRGTCTVVLSEPIYPLWCTEPTDWSNKHNQQFSYDVFGQTKFGQNRFSTMSCRWRAAHTEAQSILMLDATGLIKIKTVEL
jgi:hypothetical protein